MAAPKKKTEASESEASATTWKPTAEAKKKATTLRIIAIVLWVLAIAAEAVAIFWVLRQREFVGEEGKLVRYEDTGLVSEPGVTASFPQWAFITLLVLLVVIAALSITGSILWKKANRLDPAKKSDTVRFFVQNQLGAIIAVIAFVPLIILIFLNKDMDKNQKTIAGIVGIALAAIAAYFGMDFNPPSVEKYNADQSAVIQLLGKDEVTWVDGGGVYHVCDEVADLQTGSEIKRGTTAEAIEAHKERLTLRFVSELQTCGLSVPTNADDITDALRTIQEGGNAVLPQPEWADPDDAPIQIETVSSESDSE